ncbi:DUF1674 domain-containing protein [Insolitispirillum peregrinum]|uniref:DUF1674 domain-containing protein n=1 Tax=Insolitispirillum peregrinum TaxID=80876 RepID=A0A1N7PCP6_9PROT|nr:succinate dehydrogenase assembly factor 4 [Insolitispirillum peregrinum]SIT08354.1 Protein of unknown function [Insolitispirillum peregrinum]
MTDTPETAVPTPDSPAVSPPSPAPDTAPEAVEELGGPKGPEPTRFGDWERGGRCSDF